MNTGELISRFHSKDATVGVIGLGYVGLPLVLAFGRAGFRVLGLDIDAAKAAALNAGESYIRHIPASDIQELRKTGRFDATCDFSRVGEADAILICVPTPLTQHREPDLSYIENTGRQIAPHIRAGQLIVLESTTYPGTTNDVLCPILQANGLAAGRDFLLAYSPEREDPGNATHTTGRIPKVVGGIDIASLDAADALYSQIVVKTVRVSSTQTAEAVKLLENIFRCVNIAMVNELKMIYTQMGIDVWEVIEAAKSKPFGFMPFYPGPGLGGHCIPIDPFYLTWKAREYDVATRFIELAGEINRAMPGYVVTRLMDALNDRGKTVKGSRVLLLGIAYKPDVADPRESPGFTLIELLQARGAHVDYNDPHIPRTPPMRHHDVDLVSVDLTEKSLGSYDCVIIATAHTAYDYAFIAKHAKLVIDTRNALHGIADGDERVVKA